MGRPGFYQRGVHEWWFKFAMQVYCHWAQHDSFGRQFVSCVSIVFHGAVWKHVDHVGIIFAPTLMHRPAFADYQICALGFNPLLSISSVSSGAVWGEETGLPAWPAPWPPCRCVRLWYSVPVHPQTHPENEDDKRKHAGRCWDTVDLLMLRRTFPMVARSMRKWASSAVSTDWPPILLTKSNCLRPPSWAGECLNT